MKSGILCACDEWRSDGTHLDGCPCADLELPPAPVPPPWLVSLLESTPASIPEPAPVAGGEGACVECGSMGGIDDDGDIHPLKAFDVCAGCGQADTRRLSIDVTPRLLEWIEKEVTGRRVPIAHLAAVRRLVESRAVYGWNQYHLPLQTCNGRNPIRDRQQEGADGMQYVEQAFLEGADLSPVVRLAAVELVHLIDRAKAQGYNLDPLRRLLPVLVELVGEA